MKKLLLACLFTLSTTTVLAQSPLICIGEDDGTPYVWNTCVPGIITTGTVTDNGDGTVTLDAGTGSGGTPTLTDNDNIIYVGKWGNDANDGLTMNDAKLTVAGGNT